MPEPRQTPALSPETPVTKFYKKLSEVEQLLHDGHIKQVSQELGPLRTLFNEILQYVKSREATKAVEGAKAKLDQMEAALQEAKAQIEAMRVEVDKLTAPPSAFGVFGGMYDTKEGTAVIYDSSGRKFKVNLAPKIKPESLRIGCQVVLNEVMHIIEALPYEMSGEVVVVETLPEEGYVRVTLRHDEKVMARLGEDLQDQKLSVGDHLLYDHKSKLVLKRLEKAENKELWLETIQPLEYDQIGGLRAQVEKIRKEIEMPFLHKDLYRTYNTKMAKGILLYGPPGCGKTLIARAIAYQLAKDLAARHGMREVKGYFINVKGPQLLNKYVGETERQIREMFTRAKERASESCPVIVFMDEADALLKTRGTGVSSDVEMTTVAQFLVELDGVDIMENVLLIIASNRQDLIDPAVLRPGRVDLKVKVIRPDREGVKEIFNIYLVPKIFGPDKKIPIHDKYRNPKHKAWKPEYESFGSDHAKIMNYLIEGATRRLWAKDEEYHYKNPSGKDISVRNSIMELTLNVGGKYMLYLKDFVSGAMIENIVNRATRNTIERIVLHGLEEGGIMLRDLCVAIEQEMGEIEDLPNTGKDAQAWLENQNIRGEVVHIRSLVDERRREFQENMKTVEVTTTGHYL